MEISNLVKIVILVPESHAETVREALAQAGAGKMGAYTHCSFSQKGVGRFKPEKGAKPYIGTQGSLEEVGEERIETICQKEILAKVIKEVKKAHPYEEPAIDIFPLYEIPT